MYAIKHLKRISNTRMPVGIRTATSIPNNGFRDIHDIVADNFNAYHWAFNAPSSDVTVSSILCRQFGSQNYILGNPALPYMKQLRDSEKQCSDEHSKSKHIVLEPLGKKQRTFILGYPCDPDRRSKGLQSSGSTNHGGHVIIGTSSAPSPIELPSFQCTETDTSCCFPCSSTLFKIQKHGDRRKWHFGFSKFVKARCLTWLSLARLLYPE